MTRYRQLAVDLDGTLVGPNQHVSPGHAPPNVQQAARCVIGRHDADGLGEFVDELLAGRYD